MATRLNPATIRPVIEERKVKWLGRAGDFDYGLVDGAEYAVGIAPVADPAAYVRREGEVLIAKRVKELFDGSVLQHDQLHRAVVVPEGTYADLSTREQAAKAKAARHDTVRPLDALRIHSLLRAREPEVLWTAPQSDNILALALSNKARGVILPGREQQQGPAAIIAVLHEKGVDLKLSADGAALVPVAMRARAMDTTRELVTLAAPLLLAHLRGEPLRCQLKHSEKEPPVAASLLVGGAAACEQHLTGELAPD